MNRTKVTGGVVAGIALLILYTLFTGMFTVDTHEVMVIKRFGKYNRTVTSGLKFKIPYGVETATAVAQPNRVLKQEFGYRTVKAGEKTEYAQGNFEDESMFLTGDRGIIIFPWACHYKIIDPKDFLFEHRNVLKTFRMINEAVMRQLIGDYSYDECITMSRDEVTNLAMEMINTLCEEYKTGIRVTMIEPQDVSVHDKVKPAFNEVNEARQEMEKTINQAWEAYNKVIPKAKGDAKKQIEQALGFKVQRINNARGHTTEFTQLAAEWQTSRQITETRLMYETMRKILPKVNNKVIVDDRLRSVFQMIDFSRSFNTRGGNR